MTTSADTAHETPEARSPAQPRTAGGRQLAALAVAGVLIGAAAVVGLLGSLRYPSNAAEGGGAAARPASGPALPPSDIPAPTAPGGAWSVSRRWSGRVPVVTFELLAGNDIGLMDRRSRPVLVLRCSTVFEAFVITGGAAAIENADHFHSIRIGFDGAQAAEERWLDSEERDALFAPDPAAFARRLTTARTMRFEFKPFGAPRAAAAFNVGGLDSLAAKMPKTCAW